MADRRSRERERVHTYKRSVANDLGTRKPWYTYEEVQKPPASDLPQSHKMKNTFCRLDISVCCSTLLSIHTPTECKRLEYLLYSAVDRAMYI